MKNKFVASLYLFLLLILPSVSISQTDTSDILNLIEMPLEDILNMKVITTSKTPRLSSNVTQKVDIVTSKQINRMISGNRNISELIQYLPGASVKVLSRNDANWGAYGGIGPKYSTFMLQGLPIDAFIDPQSLDAMAIKHIEIQRGPASILYPNYLSQDFAGNQSPLAGTVNLILKDYISKPQTMVSLGYGYYNTYSGQVYHENRFGRLHVFGGISYEKSDYSNYGSEDSWLNMQKNPKYHKEKAFLGASIYLDKSEKHKITLFGNQTFHSGDFGRINRKYDYGYSLMDIKYSGKLKDNLELTFKAGLRWYERLWEEDIYDTLSTDYLLSETFGVEQMIIPVDLSLTYNHLKNSNLTMGVDNQQASYLTWHQPVAQYETASNDASVSQIGMYLQEELQLNKFVLRGGVRYNVINYDIGIIGSNIPGSESEKWNVLLWSTGIKCRLTEKFTIFTNAGNSFMSPGLKSIGGTVPLSKMFVSGYNGQLPNSDLRPEKGLSLDLGFDYLLPLDLYISVRAFNTRIKDAIIDNVISQNPSQTMSVNADGNTIAKGFEFSVKQQINKKIEWFANLTYTNSEIDNPDNPDQHGVEVPFIPEWMGNIGASLFLTSKIEICTYVHFGGLIYDSNSKVNRHSFSSKELVNLFASKTFIFKGEKKLNVFVKAYNCTNNKYKMPWQFQDTGFNITFGTRMMF